MTSLVDRILTSWPHTARLLVVLIVLSGVAIFGLWLLQADVALGPLHINPPMTCPNMPTPVFEEVARSSGP